MKSPDSTQQIPDPSPEEENPPIFRTWRQWYAAIIIELVILVVIFRVITVFFE